MPTIQRQIAVDAPTEDVWHVLTTRELVREWAAAFADEIDVLGPLRQGGRITWKAPDIEDRRGVIAAFEPERLLRIDYAEGEGPARSERYELQPDQEGSRLTLTIELADPAARNEMDHVACAAAKAIASLAGELAVIRGRRPAGA